MLGELVPCGGGDAIPLLKSTLLIGRRSRCDIALKFPNVSSHHCQLEFMEGHWFVRDMGSRNGIKVNDVRCDKKWLLPGDILSVARHRFEVIYQPQGNGPPPEIEEDPFAQSLLEKAGLEPAASRMSEFSRKSREAPPVAGRTATDKTSDDDDEALKWLSEEPDEP